MGGPLTSLPANYSVFSFLFFHTGFQSNTGFPLIRLREKLAGLWLMCPIIVTMATGFQDGAPPVPLLEHMVRLSEWVWEPAGH